MAKQYGFGKKEKLKSRKMIQSLFASGRSVSAPSLRVKYFFLPPEGDAPAVQAGVTVSKKHFKRAVDRNRIKRLLREAYRLQKADLLSRVKESNQRAVLFLIYTEKSMLSFEAIYKAVGQCLNSLQQKVVVQNETTG